MHCRTWLEELTLCHDFVYLAVLLTRDKFFMLIGKLNLDTHVVLRLLDERDVANHHESSSHGIVRSIDVEVKLLEADLSTRVDANVRQHGTNVSRGRRALRGVRVSDKP